MPSFPQSANIVRVCASAILVLLASATWAQRALAQSVYLDGQATPAFALTQSTTQSAVSINAATGDVSLRSLTGGIQCSAAAAPTITNFSPTSPSVLPGTNITLNWSSTNTTSCTPAQGPGTTWASQGTLNPSGSLTFAAPQTSSATPITFQLNCTNGSTQVSQTTQVTVQNDTPGTCTAIYPNGSVSSWNGVFNTWPSYEVRRRISAVPGNGYTAWSFVATSVAGQFGTIATTEYPFDGDGSGQFSISRTPGCFTPSELGSNCLGPVSRNSSVSWRNGGGSNRCALTPGVTYYVNFTYGNATSGPGPHCPAGPGQCGADVTNSQQD